MDRFCHFILCCDTTRNSSKNFKPNIFRGFCLHHCLIAIRDVWVQEDFNLLGSSAIEEARSDLKVVIFIQILLINLNFRSESLGIKISSVLSYVQSRSHLCWYFGSSRSVIQDWLIVLILSILLCRIFLFRIKIVVNSRVLPSLDSPNKGENSYLNVLFVKLYHFAVVKLIKRNRSLWEISTPSIFGSLTRERPARAIISPQVERTLVPEPEPLHYHWMHP